MKIKYHDNTIEPQYGSDDTLADNWDPNKDYGDEYVAVHFRINTKKYGGYPDFRFDPKDKEAFNSETAGLLTPLGWEIKAPTLSGACMEGKRGFEKLYFHPADFSGIMMKNNIKTIAEVLAGAKAFTLLWVDIYDDYACMTDEEYLERLREEKKGIREYVLSRCRTTRTTKMHYADGVADGASFKFAIPRVGSDLSVDRSIVAEFTLNEIIPELIKEGYLVSQQISTGVQLIRTINKSEQKQRRLFLDF